MSIFSIIPLLPKLENAACKDYEFPDLFFPIGKKREAKNLPNAQAICNLCSEATRCLEFALEQKIEHGIWAGTTPDMRARMKPAVVKKSINPLTVADRIRELNQKGKSPQQIASLLNQDISYVHLALSRKSKNKGEIQLPTTTKKSLEDSYSSSESA